MKKNKKKNEIILAAGILAAAFLLYIGNLILFSKPSTLAEIAVDGNVVATLDLAKDTEMDIEGYEGGSNHLVIKDGEASVTDASCPDKVCMKKGGIQKNGEMIICLPNRVTIRITGNED